jgi:acyl-CoA thioesterase-1
MRGFVRAVSACLLLGTLSACAIRDAACSVARSTNESNPAENGLTSRSGALANSTFTITFLGDSVTAGLGLRTEDAYPSLIERKFATDGYDSVDIVNAGVTGQTTADGVRRLDELLEPTLRVLVVALGSNDALRGISAMQTGENLSTIIEAAIERRVIVVLAGMEPPANLGVDYRRAFLGAFAQLASDYKDSIAYMPSLLEGVAGNPALNQADGGRPNADGARVIADHLYAKLQVIVDSLGAAR